MTLPETVTALPDTDVLTTMPEASHRPERLASVEETKETGIVVPEAIKTMLPEARASADDTKDTGIVPPDTTATVPVIEA